LKYTSKHLFKRVSKKTKVVINVDMATEVFLKQLSSFKRRKKRKWVIVLPILLKGKTKQFFVKVVSALEEFRSSLVMSMTMFYRLVSEFILVPSGRKYYPMKELFCEDSVASEEFISRINDTLPWLADLVNIDFSSGTKFNKMVTSFERELAKRKICTDLVTYESKEWFCVYAIKIMAEKKNWSENELLDRIAKFYKRRMKKVTPEMVLGDLSHGELDRVDLTQKKVSRKISTVEAITQEEWYPEWLENLKKNSRGQE
jgi:hypothetical protein